MVRGSGKDEIIVIDRWTMKELARYSSATEASMELGVRINSIYVSIHHRKPAYECYFVYKSELKNWKPAPECFKRRKGTKTTDKLEALRMQIK